MPRVGGPRHGYTQQYLSEGVAALPVPPWNLREGAMQTKKDRASRSDIIYAYQRIGQDALQNILNPFNRSRRIVTPLSAAPNSPPIPTT